LKEIRISDNPNCVWTGEMVFSALDAPRPIRGLRAAVGKEDEICDVVGVEPGGRWTEAFVQKVADSGEGTAWLIYGGEWGIRLRPGSRGAEAWSFKNPAQWGEPYKVYGSIDDVVF